MRPHPLNILIIAVAVVMATSPLHAGGTWATIPAGPALPKTAGLCNPVLMTDGTVIAHDCGQTSLTGNWYQLTPDSHGHYKSGTWSTFKSLPIGYAPEWFASAILPDGKVIVEGGEDNIGCATSGQVWTSLGAIYDPAHPKTGWTPVPRPSGKGWVNKTPCVVPTKSTGGIGDAPSIVLPGGTFMLGACCAYPSVEVLLTATSPLTWASTSAPVSPCLKGENCPDPGQPYQEEQGYTLLQNDKVMTISSWSPPNVEAYSGGSWSALASTPVALPDTCGSGEIGPAITRPDGSVVAFGGNLCTGKPDPTAIYDPSTDKWKAGPNEPSECYPGTKSVCTSSDSAAAMLPGGNILFEASGVSQKNPPVRFFEFTSAKSKTPNSIEDEPAAATGAVSRQAAGYFQFVVLPTGNVLATNITQFAQIYTPGGKGAEQEWQPTITSMPGCLTPGGSFVLKGTQLNGLSQGVNFGDDLQAATNYPLIRLTHFGSGVVVYARTYDFSTMSIAPGKAGSTKFVVSPATTTGWNWLQVVVNGIATERRKVKVATSCPGAAGGGGQR